MYRFKIYRNTADLASAEKAVDNLRYERSYYVYERTITPYYTELNFKWETGDRMFFRKTLDGTLTLLNEDFDWINEIRLDGDESDRYRILTVEKSDGGVWEEKWVGFFSVINAEFDLDKCSAEFSELNVWDEYSILLENIERERDFFSAPQRTVNYYYDTYYYDTYIITEEYSAFFTSVPPAEPTTLNEIFPDPTDKYTLYRKSLLVTGVVGETCYYTITWEYRRNYNNSVASPGGAEWVNGGAVPGTNGVNHWIRWFDDYGTADVPGYSYNSVPGKYIYDGTHYVQQYTYTIVRNLPTRAENERARLMYDVLFMLLHDLVFRGTNLLPTSAFISEFLNSPTNPITGEDNELRRLYMFQITDVRETTDPATKSPISFKDAETWFEFLNCGWYIDDGFFRIEHQKFFDNGLSYSGAVVGIDILSNPDWVKQARATQKFSYLNDSLPRVEKFSFVNNDGQDYLGLPIFYRGNMANWGEGNEESHSFQISTDLQSAIDYESGGVDGLLLVATRLSGADLWVIYDTGLLSGGDIWNAPLATSTVHDKYWKYGRPVGRGIMNGEYTLFEASDNFVQEEFQISYCDDINPYQLVRTEYGDGKIVTALKSLVDERVTLTLKY